MTVIVGPPSGCVRQCRCWFVCGLTHLLWVHNLSLEVLVRAPEVSLDGYIDSRPFRRSSPSPRPQTQSHSRQTQSSLSSHPFKPEKCLLSESSPPLSLRPLPPPGLSPAPGTLFLPLSPLAQDLLVSSPALMCPSSFPSRRHRPPPTPLPNPFSRVKWIPLITSSESRTLPPVPSALGALTNRGMMSPLLPTAAKISLLTRGGMRKLGRRNRPPSPCTCSSMGFVSRVTSSSPPL